MFLFRWHPVDGCRFHKLKEVDWLFTEAFILAMRFDFLSIFDSSDGNHFQDNVMAN